MLSAAACNTQDVLGNLKGTKTALCNWRETRFDTDLQQWRLHEYTSVPGVIQITQNGLQYRLSVSSQVTEPGEDLVHDISLTSDFDAFDDMDVNRSDETAADLLLSGTWEFKNFCDASGTASCDRVRWAGHMVYASPKTGNANKLRMVVVSGKMDRDLDPQDDLAFREYACRVK
jgi:hypothetical protein